MSSPVEIERANCHIFMIDDEEIVLQMYSEYLRESGFRNLHAFTRASDAINMLRCLRPDVILTDIHMPDVDGSVLTQLVREFEHLEAIPLVAITADGRKETAVEIIDSGANAVLIKPVTPDELLGQLALVLDGAPQAELS
ncbi:response regulator [Mariniblastus fucicola]|uniref:Chemotaxis protein CheY n=1 Tax=Mariniblastus fucicola TaxID=980251 RepID=A0A5B9P967_9BACT|nr:response regulator [Mariniblastus fucicola]QEG21775.1 Chemotaxis protein CheY [Mariniblastus fucicola]